MSKSVGKSVVRVDAYEKATGRAKYMDDLCDRSALIAKICHSTIAHGFVKSVDTSAAEAVPGVVKVLTCFDAPDIEFPTAGHPWSTDPHHQDVADRKLLNRHVRYYGDEVAVVIAEDDIAAAQAVRAIRVEYEVLPFVLDVQEAMAPEAPQLHERCPGNLLPAPPTPVGSPPSASPQWTPWGPICRTSIPWRSGCVSVPSRSAPNCSQPFWQHCVIEER